MADNLGSTSLSFNTGNMKPESGEQIDAVWGGNIADNTAYNKYRRKPVFGMGPSIVPLSGYSQIYQEVHFPVELSFTHLHGTGSLEFDPGSPVGIASADLWIDGTRVVEENYSLSADSHDFSFTWEIASLLSDEDMIMAKYIISQVGNGEISSHGASAWGTVAA